MATFLNSSSRLGHAYLNASLQRRPFYLFKGRSLRMSFNNARNFAGVSGTPLKFLEKHRYFLPYEIKQARWFWGVEVAFNKVDEERVRLAGPDRAAAEWVLRNGGNIKWTTSSKPLKDYNLLPSTGFEDYKLEDIDLSATDVIAMGFEHLKDLHHLRKVKLHGIRTINNEALGHLILVKDTLEILEISKCPMITEKGLHHLSELKKLKVLVLCDLNDTKNFKLAVENLKKSMPWVSINTGKPFMPEQETGD